jgi:hypothetical protein
MESDFIYFGTTEIVVISVNQTRRNFGKPSGKGYPERNYRPAIGENIRRPVSLRSIRKAVYAGKAADVGAQ